MSKKQQKALQYAKLALLSAVIASLSACYPEQGEIQIGLCGQSSNSVEQGNLLVKATLAMYHKPGCD